MLFFRSKRSRAVECFRQGKLAADEEDFDLALSCFNEAIRLDPGLALGYFGRGFVYLKRAQYGEAITDFSEALRLTPDDAMTYFYRGLAYEGKGDLDRQREDHQRAVTLAPELERFITALWDPCPAARRDQREQTSQAPADSSSIRLDLDHPSTGF